jgi:hypothetical protein
MVVVWSNRLEMPVEDVADRVDEVARAAEIVARHWHDSDTPVTQIGAMADERTP